MPPETDTIGGSPPWVEIALVKAEISSLKGDIGGLAAAVAKLTEQGQWSIQKIGPLASVGGIVGFILVLFINNQTAPLTAQMKSMDTALAAIAGQMVATSTWRGEVDKILSQNAGDDRGSAQDRADLKATLNKDEDRNSENNEKRDEKISALETRTSATIERICEIEAQFASDENSVIMRDQYIQRWLGIFYRKIFGENMPALGPAPAGLATGKPCFR